MALDLDQVIDRIRQRGALDDPGTSDTTSPDSDNSIAQLANEVQSQIAMQLITATSGHVSTRNMGWFLKIVDREIGADGRIYLPADFGVGVNVKTSQTSTHGMTRAGLGDPNGRGDYRAHGDFLDFETGGSGKTRWIEYNSTLSWMLLKGTASAGSSTTITLDSSNMSYGLPLSSEDDHLNGCQIKILSGTGSGQTRRITDYVGDTGVATINEAWSTNPDGTSVWSTLVRVPDPGADLIVYRVLDSTPFAPESGEFGAAVARLEQQLSRLARGRSFFQ